MPNPPKAQDNREPDLRETLNVLLSHRFAELPRAERQKVLDRTISALGTRVRHAAASGEDDPSCNGS